ncbi:Grx4 family monothiol glutaredoxin [Sporothrix schenckii ATCC 58251]|uniref:Grx4 family monothiol glutaredoxin n=1 Tax=Sporothrix schenckii (strain ATCC 58251 / de Perez 2211183) TaxID=1391915 RepID=U7PSP5_SPOS1|nr:Grx4 family monothiol glutaredoxin [Sporothrix schenckii ATCC 58251]
MSTIQEIKSVDEWDAHLRALDPSTLLVASFHAPWAAPCAQMATVLQALADEYPPTPTPPTTSWVSLNAEDLSDVSEQYDVTAVPFLVLLRNGQVLETVSGSSALKVRAAIEQHAKGGAAGGASASPAAAAAGQAQSSGAGAAIAPIAAATPDPAQQKEELFKRLGDLVKAAPVMLFMKGTPGDPQCGFSRRLVAILREHGVKYGFFNILADDEVRQGLKEFADWPTYPQLWMRGELVGGLDIIKEELESDKDFFTEFSVKPSATAA